MIARISVVDSIGQLLKTATTATAASVTRMRAGVEPARGASQRRKERRRPARREQHQQRHERVAIAREHVERTTLAAYAASMT